MSTDNTPGGLPADDVEQILERTAPAVLRL
jgi:hypothetical protein